MTTHLPFISKKPSSPAGWLASDPADLSDAMTQIALGRTSALEQMKRSLGNAEILSSQACGRALIAITPERALDAAQRADALRKARRADTGPALPLSGMAVSVKDLYDVQGEVTGSGGNLLATRPPAAIDCPAVARLRGAGAGLVGRSNQSELAFSGVGYNPHFGTPHNPGTLAVDPHTPRISGGSSSGAAASVAGGAAWIGLGSDTGGSIRIPAALCGLVGFKPTASTVPTTGAVPLSTTLDTVCAITRSVRDAALVHGVLSASRVVVNAKAPGQLTLGIAQSVMLDGLDATVQTAFDRSVAVLRRTGVRLVQLPLPELLEPPKLQTRAGFSSSELTAWLRMQGLWERRSEIDPRVLYRLNGALGSTAADYVELHQLRSAWIAKMQPLLAGVDAVLSPTVPMVAPPIAEIASDDAAFFRVNAALLRNPSLVNFLNGCAISIPCNRPDELPVGLMLWHAAHHDLAVLGAAQTVETLLASSQ